MSKAARRFTDNIPAMPIATIVELVGELVHLFITVAVCVVVLARIFHE